MELNNKLSDGKRLDTLALSDQEFSKQVSDGGGALTAYFSGRELIQMYYQLLTFSGFVDMTYYYSNDQLLYLEKVERKLVGKYDDGDWVEWDFNATPDTAFVGRYYFDDRQLIAIQKEGTPYFAEPFDLQHFLTTADTLSALLLRKRKTNE